MTTATEAPAAEPEPARLRQSDTIAELAKALAAAQGDVEDAMKDRNNPAFRSQYADLASVWHACRAALSTHGLCVVQSPSYGRGVVSVTTRLMHASGEWLEGTLSIPVGKADAHGIGSATTYARRYSLAAMVGVAPDDDDDGNAAAASRQQTRQQQRPPQRQQPPARRAEPQPARGVAAADAETPDPHRRGDDGSWEQWTAPPAAVRDAEEPHEWYCAALKGLRTHAGVRTLGHTRALYSWLAGSEIADPKEVESDAGASQAMWQRMIDRSNEGVAFVRMLPEALRAAEQPVG